MPWTDREFCEWEGDAFGFGYGSGESHVLPALRKFVLAIPKSGNYNYEVLEGAVGPVVAWLFINRLAAHDVDVIEYGTSPRFGWLTPKGRDLAAFLEGKTDDELVELVCNYDPMEQS